VKEVENRDTVVAGNEIQRLSPVIRGGPNDFAAGLGCCLDGVVFHCTADNITIMNMNHTQHGQHEPKNITTPTMIGAILRNVINTR
jgi:hypothetical protein